MVKSSIIKQRDKDLYEVFIEIIGSSPYPIRLNDVLKKTVNHPAKKFYTSSRMAMEVINKVRNGEKLKMSPERERMFGDIINLAQIQQGKYPNKTFRHIVEDVMEKQAPEFYLKPSSAKIILHHERKRQKAEQIKQIKHRNERIKKRKLRDI